MPLFEYRCEGCRRKFTLLIGMTAAQPEHRCPRCGGDQIRRLISRFAVARSEEDRLDNLDPDGLENTDDPRAMAEWMRRMGQEMGEDLGDDFEELVEEAIREEETGQPAGETELDESGSMTPSDGDL